MQPLKKITQPFHHKNHATSKKIMQPLHKKITQPLITKTIATSQHKKNMQPHHKKITQPPKNHTTSPQKIMRPLKKTSTLVSE